MASAQFDPLGPMWETGIFVAKPIDTEYRAAILGAFNKHAVRSIREINEHLKQTNQFKSYNSTRRILIKMEQEGLLSELPGRGDKNSVQYSRLVFNTSVRLVTYDERVVELRTFLSELANLEMPSFIKEAASLEIKRLMFDAIGSAYPNGYKGKRDVPDIHQIQQNLNGALELIKQLHVFLKAFIDSGVFIPVARDNLAQDFKTSHSLEHAVIVEELWNDSSKEHPRDD